MGHRAAARLLLPSKATEANRILFEMLSSILKYVMIDINSRASTDNTIDTLSRSEINLKKGSFSPSDFLMSSFSIMRFAEYKIVYLF